jgi:ATP-dependent Lon protease
MEPWEAKLKSVFGNAVVDKGLMIKFDGLRLPRFVSEYLVADYIGRFGAREGVEQMDAFLDQYYPKPNLTDTYHYRLQQEGEINIVDNFKISVHVEKHGQDHTLSIPALNITNAKVLDRCIIEDNPRLLGSGLWGMGKIVWDARTKRVGLAVFRPFQVSDVDLLHFRASRAKFSADEWLNVLISSIGFNPAVFATLRSRLIILARLLPLVQKSVFLYEFGRPGTGKTYIFDRLSNNSFVISGSTITPAKLFRDVRTREEGLLRKYDALLFDEIDKVKDCDLADEVVNKLLKFMESNTFDRGGVEMTSHSSLIFSGNLGRTYRGGVPAFLEPLAKKLKGDAFLDRICGAIPGWEIDPLSNSNANFAQSQGFSADYLSSVLSALRQEDWEARVGGFVEFSKNTTNRDEKAILRTSAGFMKLLFPNSQWDPLLAQVAIAFAVEMRQYIVNQRFDLYSNCDDTRILEARFAE